MSVTNLSDVIITKVCLFVLALTDVIFNGRVGCVCGGGGVIDYATIKRIADTTSDIFLSLNCIR